MLDFRKFLQETPQAMAAPITNRKILESGGSIYIIVMKELFESCAFQNHYCDTLNIQIVRIRAICRRKRERESVLNLFKINFSQEIIDIICPNLSDTNYTDRAIRAHSNLCLQGVPTLYHGI